MGLEMILTFGFVLLCLIVSEITGLGLVGSVIIVAVVGGWILIKMSEHDEEKLKKDKGYVIGKFYEECLKNNIHNLDSVSNVERAKKILAQPYYESIKKMPLDDIKTEIETIKERRRQIEEENQRKEEQRRIDEIKAREKKLFDELYKFSKFTKLEKRKQMLTALESDLREASRELSRKADTARHMFHEREIDWSVMGGIAEGLAGPAAGIMVATEVQQKNKNIKERNEAASVMVQPYVQKLISESYDLELEANRVSSQISKLNVTLMDETIKKEELFKNLTFTNRRLDISETGTVSMTVDVKMKDKLVIYDDVDAVVDGVIEAILYQNNEEIGRVKLVCPVYGLSSSRPIQLKGMCLYSANKEEKCTIKFIPVSLWAIESQVEVSDDMLSLMEKVLKIQQKD